MKRRREIERESKRLMTLFIDKMKLFFNQMTVLIDYVTVSISDLIQ